MSSKDVIKGSTRGLAVDSRLLPIIAVLWPIFTRMSAVSQRRVALAHGQHDLAQRLLREYARLLQYAACQREVLRFADAQAQLLALEEKTERGVHLLRAILGDTTHRQDPVYARLEAAQSMARLTAQITIWRHLMQAYWSLGAKGCGSAPKS